MADNRLSTFLPDDKAAFGVFPQMQPRRRLQDREASANVPLDVMRGRLAGLLGLPADLLNLKRSLLPQEAVDALDKYRMIGPEVPYGTEQFLKDLPLAPTSRVGEVAGQAGAFVPLNPMPAARAAAAGIKALGPTAGRMAEGYLQRQGLMPNIVPRKNSVKSIDDLLAKYPDVKIDASVNKNDLNLSRIVVPKDMRNQGIGTQIMSDLSEYADSIGKRITLTPSSDFGGNVGKLKDFYKDLGFVENKGRNKDFSTREAMYREPKPLEQVSEFQYPQEEAMRLAQQRAALPAEQGGLGLPVSNTAEQRAAAQYGKDMVHFSRAGGDYTTLDSGKFATAPFDAVGTHVGTPQAAMDRFRNTTATTDQIKGATYPVTILGDRPLMNANGMPFGEDDLNAFLRQQGGHNWSDIQGGKMTYQDMNAKLRKKLFEEQGYTSIPYYNEVEGKGSISYIVPPDNIRSRFAAFDPFRRNAAIAAAMGAAAPDLLAAQPKQQPSQNSLNSFIQ